MIKLKTKRALLLMLMSVMTVINAYSETTADIDGLRYSLSGAYAKVLRDLTNYSYSSYPHRKIVPSVITYKNLQYTVNSIGASAFSGSGVNEVELPETIEEISDYAFNTPGITKVKLNEGIKEIGKKVFANSKITDLVIPSTVVSFGIECFDGCDMLRTLIYLGTNPPKNWTATSLTYVPNQNYYSTPTYSINNPNIRDFLLFSESEYKYSGKPPSPTWKNNAEGYSVKLVMPSLHSEVGSYVDIIPATFKKGEVSFTAYIPYQYTIKPARLKAKVVNMSRAYGEPNPEFTVTYSGFLNGDNKSILTTKPVVTTNADEKSAVGTYPITISGGEAKNYTFEYESGELTINKAPLNVQVTDASKIYGNDNPTFTIGYSGLKNGETAPEWIERPKFTTTATKESDTGIYEVVVACEPKNYTIVTNTPGKLTIEKATLNVKANNATMDYGGPMPTYSYTYSGFVNGDNENAILTRPSAITEATVTSNVGNYSIIPKGAQAKNYVFSYAEGTLTIKKRQLTAKVNSTSRLYGEKNPIFTVEYKGLVNNETKNVLDVEPIVSTEADVKSAVGTYSITISGGEAKNYTLEYEPGELTINKAPLNVQVTDVSKIYGSENPSFSIGFSGLKNGEAIPEWIDRPKFTTKATKESDTGIYEVAVACEPKNYTIVTNTPGKLTIEKATLNVKANNATMDYGGPMPTYSYTYSGFVNGDNENAILTRPSAITEATVTSNVGNYSIIPKGAQAKNYVFSYAEGTLTIKKRQLTAKVNSTSRLYGEKNPIFTVEYKGLVNNETKNVLDVEPIVSTEADVKSAVGTYPITISGGEAKNYTLEYEPGELTINKASLNIQVMDATRIYGNDNPTFTIGYSGLKNGETAPEWIEKPTFTTKATKESDTGIYEVAVACEPKNYTITTNTPGKLTIEKATLNVKANNATMDYGGPMPTYSYTYSGFMNGDDERAIATKPSIATEATVKSDAGTYTITPEGAQAKNYDFSYTAGTLTINKRILNVKANSASRMYGEENPTFTIEYDGFVNNETKDALEEEPKVSTTATSLSKAGTYDIVVSGGRSANYAMTYQNGQLTITPRPLKAFVGNYERPYGEDNPRFELQYDGFAGSDTESSFTNLPIARTSATRTSNVGTYEIQVTGGYSPNYTLSYGKGILTITKAEQDFTWEQDLTSLKVGDQVELQAYTSSKLPISFTTDADDYAEIYKAGTKTYMECKKAGSFHIKAVQEGNDNYYPTQRINKNVTIIDDEDNKPTLNIKQAENGMISTKVSKGGTYTFTILAESGWKIHSVTFNETDVTGDLNSDNTYTTPKITENSTLTIIYEQDGSTVDAVKSSKVNIHATNRGICVNGVDVDDTIQVFTLDGILQQSVRATESQVEIPLQKDQVYVVKAGGKTVKLRL